LSILEHPARRERQLCGRVAIFAVSVGALASTIARAADQVISDVTVLAADVDAAKSQLAIGQQAYDEARHEEALVAFEAAYAAYPLADFQYNIGLCHERLGHVEAAILAFESYLGGKPDAKDRLTVERRIAVLEGAQREAVSPPVMSHVATTPRPLADLIDPFPSRTERRTDDPRTNGKRAIAGGASALALGVGIGVGGGLGFGLMSAKRDAQPGRDRDADRLFALEIASIAVGAVLVGTGIGLVVVGKRKQRRARGHAWLAPTPSGLVFAGRF